MSSAKLNATRHRWVAELADFRFKVKYYPGSSHEDADFFSHMPEDIHHIIKECCQETSLSAIGATYHQKNNHINWVSTLTINSATVNYNPCQEDKLDFKHLPSSSIQAYQPSIAFSPINLFNELLRKRIVRMSQLRLKRLCVNGKIFLLVKSVCFIVSVDKLHNWSYHHN